VQTFGDLRPELSYPCTWTYRIICTDQEALRSAVTALMGASEHVLEFVGDSSSGRYARLELRVHVRDEGERNDIFTALGQITVVRFVL
jgi:putative lipoic acid-binding regulatory protein